MKKLIVTGDDFGLSPAVNEGIERAYRDGILRTTSLMVGSPAASDAVARARRLPGLKVGLHVVVSRGQATAAPDAIPDLLNSAGLLPDNLFACGVRYFFLPRVRRQLEAEIRAQFHAFRETGLQLDHVNGHNHMHLHPTVLSCILRLGREYGLRAIRVPSEPPLAAWRGAGGSLPARLLGSLFLTPWTGIMKLRIRRAGLASNDYIFGLVDTGRMCAQSMRGLLACLPDGVSEIYLHPAVEELPGPRALPDAAACAAELNALLNRDVRYALESAGVELISFSDLGGGMQS